jgi:hypothetical protein
MLSEAAGAKRGPGRPRIHLVEVAASPCSAATTGTAMLHFSAMYCGVMLTYDRGDAVNVDAPLARYMVEHALPIQWDDAT